MRCSCDYLKQSSWCWHGAQPQLPPMILSMYLGLVERTMVFWFECYALQCVTCPHGQAGYAYGAPWPWCQRNGVSAPYEPEPTNSGYCKFLGRSRLVEVLLGGRSDNLLRRDSTLLMRLTVDPTWEDRRLNQESRATFSGRLNSS